MVMVAATSWISAAQSNSLNSSMKMMSAVESYKGRINVSCLSGAKSMVGCHSSDMYSKGGVFVDRRALHHGRLEALEYEPKVGGAVVRYAVRVTYASDKKKHQEDQQHRCYKKKD